jgi:hypothetical protein
MMLGAMGMLLMRRLPIDSLNPTGGYRACKWHHRYRESL